MRRYGLIDENGEVWSPDFLPTCDHAEPLGPLRGGSPVAGRYRWLAPNLAAHDVVTPAMGS